MITTKEFKTLHSLSDSSFDRLKVRVKKANPEAPLTRRINSKDWEILDVPLFESHLTPSPKTQKPEIVTAEIVPSALEVNKARVASSDLSIFNKPLYAPSSSIELIDRTLNPFQWEVDSTAELVNEMHQEIIDSAVATRQLQDQLWEAQKRQAIEIGVQRAKELQRLQAMASDSTLQSGLDLEAKKSGLKSIQESFS